MIFCIWNSSVVVATDKHKTSPEIDLDLTVVLQLERWDLMGNLQTLSWLNVYSNVSLVLGKGWHFRILLYKRKRRPVSFAGRKCNNKSCTQWGRRSNQGSRLLTLRRIQYRSEMGVSPPGIISDFRFPPKQAKAGFRSLWLAIWSLCVGDRGGAEWRGQWCRPRQSHSPRAQRFISSTRVVYTLFGSDLLARPLMLSIAKQAHS